ncbi:MotA/TolQ/ExbB proton channel family protein [Leptospira sp. 'Mane']|uniref:MotA/TolQ/ExbB proton channel family protein n=1 Tax=Leptospira sp. 'Mane' TaxID=3387407 RepID=UPI00398BA08C
MNWSFSETANFILFILCSFSISSVAFFLYSLSRILKLSKFLKTEGALLPKEEEYDLIVSSIERVLDWLPSLASISMLLGLLGTVMGIYTSFAEMQIAGKATIDVLAGGIKDALVTTIFGLAVAIPSLFFHQVLETSLQKTNETYFRKKINP